MKKYQKALFVFRRDLRLQDNTALLAALEDSQNVIPVFIFDPRQVTDNAYRSEHCIEFMVTSLRSLDAELREKNSRLFFFYGLPHEILPKLIRSEKCEAVFFNKDYTPFSVQRDLNIEHACQKAGAKVYSFDDALLHPPDSVTKKEGGIYTVYTPYAKRAALVPIPEPRKNKFENYFSGSLKGTDTAVLEKLSQLRNDQLAVQGGRTEALKILRNIKSFKSYDDTRNIPALDATTHLSSHLKFGTISAREVYAAVKAAFGSGHALIRELMWRDFFVQVGYHHPDVLGRAFQHKYENIAWRNDKKLFTAWCEGKTGFPIVDAGMRELNVTGYMHNRVRMITASFLVKDLHVDWQWGEKYFAQKLIDYDPLINNGNWQWAASTGCDAQPYFRIFNPWLQQKRFDPQCLYVKKWVTELKDLSPAQIHGLEADHLFRPVDYPSPVVEHKKASAEAIRLFRRG